MEQKTINEALYALDVRLGKIEKMQSQIGEMLSAQKPILNLDELSAFSGLSKSHLYKLTSNNKIPYYKQSKHCFFDREEIVAWLKEHPVKTDSDLETAAANYVTFGKKGVAA